MVEVFAYCVNAALVVLGGVVAVNPTWAERSKKEVGGALVALGLFALIFTWIQGAREEAAAERRDEAESLNVKLQGEILEISKQNRETTTETLRAALGDPDNPPYLWSDFDFKTKPLRSQVYIMNSSRKYAAHSVTASLTLDGTFLVTSRGASVPPGNRVPAAFPNKMGIDSNALALPQLDKIGGRYIFVNTIASSAGSYVQVTLMVRSSETDVRQAVRVSKIDDRSKIVFTRQDDGFPSDFAWPTQ
jgi:hypothetical protein